MPATLRDQRAVSPAMGPPLRVLDITDAYSDTVSGGVKTYLHAKAAHMAERGVDHVMVVPGAEDRMEMLGTTRVYRVAGPRVPVSPAYRLMLSVSRVREVLHRERPDVIEVGSPFVVPHLVDRARGSDRRAATVGFYHADVVRTFAEPYVPSRLAAPVRAVARTAARALVRDVYGRFDATVAASRSTTEELRSLGVPRVHTMGLGVDLETFRPLPPEEHLDPAAWGVEEGVPVGIFAGRFCAEKRLDVILDGHALLPLEERPHLVLVGGGPHLDRLRALAAERPRLTLLDYVHDRHELARAYNTADFYLATGPGETFGLSIAEAIACGLPVVAVDRAAAPDRVEGSDIGELYVHEDPASAAEALRRMTARLGPELRARARAHAEARFDWAGTFDALASLYRELRPVPSA